MRVLPPVHPSNMVPLTATANNGPITINLGPVLYSKKKKKKMVLGGGLKFKRTLGTQQSRVP